MFVGKLTNRGERLKVREARKPAMSRSLGTKTMRVPVDLEPREGGGKPETVVFPALTSVRCPWAEQDGWKHRRDTR